jgi:hypothetical protein
MKFYSVFLTLIVLAFDGSECVTRLRQVGQCGAPGSAISLQSIQVTPMPIVHPGIPNFQLKLDMVRGLMGEIKTTINLKRKVNGLTLDVRCFLAGENYFGSCTYDDLCELFEIYHDALHPDHSIHDHGHHDDCPFNYSPGLLDVNFDFYLPSISQTDLSFLSVGDYDMRVDLSDSFGYLGCLELYFSTKPL